MSMLCTTHDLGVVAEISHEFMVIYCGNIMAMGTVDNIFANSQHQYTKVLLKAIPIADPQLNI
ncbi:ABC transporter ATP-binding protein, partial [Francisella tularensis subsp. holarctica]|nr:ABC transporter ATP-binding protein [Francisella tularensis subsp. holarctica]